MSQNPESEARSDETIVSETSALQDMTVHMIWPESESEVMESSEDNLVNTTPVNQMVQQPEITELSLSELPGKERTTHTLKTDVDIKETNVKSEATFIAKPFSEEVCSNSVCTETESSTTKGTASYAIAGPSTWEPTLDYRVLHPSLTTTETDVIYSRLPVTTGKLKRKTFETSALQDMTVHMIRPESESEVMESSDDNLVNTTPVNQMVQQPEITELSLSELPGKERTTHTLKTDVDIKETNVKSEATFIAKPFSEEVCSNSVCTETESSTTKGTASYAIAGPSTWEPTLDYRVLHPSLTTTETDVIYSRLPVTTGKLKRKTFGLELSSETFERDHHDGSDEENCGNTLRKKRKQTDMTETFIISDKTNPRSFPLESSNITDSFRQLIMLDSSNINDSKIKLTDNIDTQVAVDLKFITKPSIKEYAADKDDKSSEHDAPKHSKEQTSDGHCIEVENQTVRTYETGSREFSGNLNIVSNPSETMTVTGSIVTSESCFETSVWVLKTEIEDMHLSAAEIEAQKGPYALLTAKRVPKRHSCTREYISPGIMLSKIKHDPDNPWYAFDKEFDTLVQYMDPIKVIDQLIPNEEFGQVSLLQDIKNSGTTLQISRTLLNFIKETGLDAYSKLKECLVHTEQRALATLLEHAEEEEDTSAIKWVIEQNHQQKPEDDSLVKDLKEDLIMYYRDNESYISFTPLVEEHDLPLIEFYVRPNIRVFEKPHVLSKSTKHANSEANILDSYANIFFQENGTPFTKIYLLAQAGMGKTSFSQAITMYWCQSHKPVEQSAETYDTDDLKAMKEFDLLFILHLRQYQRSSQCNLDDLVMDMCSNLSRRSRYTREFLETVLHEKRCLIILDGLDEWTHPSSCCKKPAVPHNTHPKNCSVLTTTRHWKLSTVGLSSAHIDRKLEILELDQVKSLNLELNAIAIVNDRVPKTTEMSLKELKEDFDKATLSIKHDEICNTPYVKLQLIALWYGGIPISRSRCEIYSNIIELTLERGLKKTDLPLIPTSQPDAYTTLPNCMENNASCKKYTNLLFKIGKVAFFSLFNENKESQLIFDQSMVLEHLQELELEFCLKTGLLSQSKDSSMLTKICHKIFFQHKSIQEYFVGLHISAEYRNGTTRDTILKVCQSLSEILQMSNVLIFVCGMNPNVYSDIFSELQIVVGRDPITCSYRSMPNNPKPFETDNTIDNMQSYQQMQVACFEENTYNNGNDECKIFVEDIVLRANHRDLNALITSNPQNLKSLYIQYAEFDIDHFNTLHVVLSGVCQRVSVLIGCQILMQSTNSLTTVCFQEISMKSYTLVCLFKRISDMRMLRTLRMEYIECPDLVSYVRASKPNLDDRHSIISKLINRSETYPEETLHIKLDLFQTNHIKDLHLAYVPLSQLVLAQASQLQQIHLAWITLSQLDLSKTSHLQQLHLEKIPLNKLDLSQTSLLQKLHLENIPLCQLDFSHTSQLQQLHIEYKPLSELNLPMTEWRRDLEGHNITVNEPYVSVHCLQKCAISRPIYSLPHEILFRLTGFIQNAKDVTKVFMRNIQCSDHDQSCNGIALILCQNLQLQKLQLDNIPLSWLNVSETCQLQELQFENLPLRELDISQNSQLKELKLVDIPLSVLNISQNKELKELELKNVPLSKLDVSQNSMVRKLKLDKTSMSVLEISLNSQLQQLHLTEIPLEKVKLNVERLQNCYISSCHSSCVLTHNNLYELMDSIQKASNLESLTMKNIHCSDHNDMCVGISLALRQLSNLEKLHLEEIPLKELHLPQTSNLQNLNLRKILVRQLDLSHTRMIRELNLEDISLRGLDLSQNTGLSELFLKKVHLDSGWTDFFQINTNLVSDIAVTFDQITLPALAFKTMLVSIGSRIIFYRITMTQKTMSGTALRESVLSTVNLSQPVSVELHSITMLASEWKDAFLAITSLTQPVTLKLSNITMSDLAWTDAICTISSLSQPVNLKLCSITMSDSAWKEVFHTISSMTQPVSLKLSRITMSELAWKDVFHIIGSMTQPVSLMLSRITMSDSAWNDVFHTIGSMTQRSVSLTLSSIAMSDHTWKVLFLNVGSLSQPLKLSKITMSAKAWWEMLIDTVVKLPKTVTVELHRCMGPTQEEWASIRTKSISSPAISLQYFLVFNR